MNEMIGYIFRSLHSSEKAIKNVTKTLNAQYKFNKSVTSFAIASAALLTVQHIRTTLMEKELETLRKEIEELKGEKGE